MGSTTLLSLEQKLSEAIGDFIEVDTTTDIAASTKVIKSTTLNSYDDTEDDHFKNWYAYITEGANSTTMRKISAYLSSSGQISVYGDNLSAETAAVTVRVGRFNREEKVRAINRAVEQVYPVMYKPVDNRDLITNNLLPPFIWTSSTTLTFYTASNAALAQTTDGDYVRRGTSCAKVTPSAANGYVVLDSTDYPRLLDIMDRYATLKSWAYPETTDDATVEIYTTQADGTAQSTLISTTTNTAAAHTLVELEDQTLNDDLVNIQCRLKVASSTKYVYYGQPRLTGTNVREYLLPDELQDGFISQVYVQTIGYSDDICDDLNPTNWERIYGYDIVTSDVNGTLYKFLRLPYSYSSERQIRIIGGTPLANLAADSTTISTSETGHIEVITAYAAYLLYESMEGPPSSEDVRRYTTNTARWYGKYQYLKDKHRMLRPSGTLNLPVY